MKKRIVSLVLLLGMLITSVPFTAVGAVANEEIKGESYVDLDTLYVQEGLVSHFSTFGGNASTVNLSAGTWTDLVAGKTASFKNKAEWHINDNGSVGFYTYLGTLDSATGDFVSSSTGNNYTLGMRLDFGISLLPETDFTVEYLAMYRPLYLYSETESDHILKDEYGNALETFDYSDNAAGIFVARLPVDNFGYFQSLASQLDGVCFPHMAKNASGGNLTAEELLATRGILHWVFGHQNGDAGNGWYIDDGARQKWWLGENYKVTGGLNVMGDVFQTNGKPRTYAISLDETVTDVGDTEALISLWRDGDFYTSNEVQGQINTTANGIADGGWYAESYDTAKCRFWLSANRSTDFYSARIYNRALSLAEQKHNRGVDVLNYYNIKLPTAYAEDKAVLDRILDLMSDEVLVTDPLAYVSKATEAQNKVDSCLPDFGDLADLYVKNGMVALYTAFKGDGTYLTESGNNIIWQNRLSSGKDAVLKNEGWSYDAERGGVGYDLIYGQINAEGVFSSSYAGNTYGNNNMLYFGLDLLPKDDFTLEYLARYTPHYVYDARVGELVSAFGTGNTSATTPNQIAGHPVDVIGFLSSYTMHRGNAFDTNLGHIEHKLGLLRWRSADAAGYKKWSSDYGMGNINRVDNRGTDDVESYGLTREESVTDGVVKATYIHRFNGNVQHTINCSSATLSGDNRYYTYNDDTDFYLSDRLGTIFYALRIYNRVLSAEEQNQNRAVDLLRYYDITLPEEVWEKEALLSTVFAAALAQEFVYDPLGYTAIKSKMQSDVMACVYRGTLTDKFAQSEHLASLFTVYQPETVNLSSGTWIDIVSGNTASFKETTRWHVNTDGSVGFYTYLGTLDATGAFTATSAGNNYTAGTRLDFGIAALPETDFTVEYFANYRPLYLYSATEPDHILKDASGAPLETFDYQNKGAGIFVHRLPVDNFGWFQSLASQLDGVCYPDMAKRTATSSTGTLTAEELLATRGILHWVFGHQNGDKGNAWFDLSARQKWWLGENYTVVGGLNVMNDVFQTNDTPRTYTVSLDETVTDSGETEALISLYRDGVFYTSNEAQGQLNTTAKGIADGGWYAETYDTETCRFWLSANRSTDFFTVRIYDIALTDADKRRNHAVDLILYYGIALTDEMWANETYMARLADAFLTESVATDSLNRVAKCAELQAYANALYTDVVKVEEITSLYAKRENLTAFFTTEAKSSVSVTEGYWRDYVGGNIATLGNASKGYWKVREDGAVGYDVIYGEIDGNGYGNYTPDSAFNNYNDYGTRLEFGIDLLPKGDFTVEYLAEYRPVYAVDPNGTLAGEAAAYGATLPGLQQYGQTQYTPVDSLGYLASYATTRDGVFSGRTYRGEVRWVVHEPVLPSGHWDYAYFTQTLSANADIFQTRNEIRAYGISRVKTTGSDALVTAKYTLYRDVAQYATASFSRKTYEERIASMASSANPYKPPVVTDFAKDDTGYFYLSERMSTDFYAVRVYDTALTEEDYARNRFVDLIYFYDVGIPEYLTGDMLLAQLAAKAKDIDFGADALFYEAERVELLSVIKSFESISAENTLYVQEGLVALYTAFVGDDVFLTASGSNMLWQNRVLGEKEAVFENAGWMYNSATGGVGYDLVYGQINANGVFSASYSGNTYNNKNKLSLGLSLLPKEDFTLEYVALYKPHYCYDARVGDLVDAYKSGVSGATTPNSVPSERVDVVGFVASYSTHPGNYFGDAGGYAALRWRTVDKAGLGDWSSAYGMGHDIVHRDGGAVSSYAITRDETMSGTGDSLVTNAVYTFYRDGEIPKTTNGADAIIDASSKTASGTGRYFNKDDDTDFYLSYRLGTTFYALRIYDRVLNEQEQKQNHMADILNYYGVEIPDTFAENEVRYRYVLSICETLSFEEDAEAYDSLKRTLQTAVLGDDKQVTLIVGDEEKTEIAYGAFYPLPKSVEGTNLFAWHKIDADGNVIAKYAPGESVKLTETNTIFRALTLSSPTTVYGVSAKAMGEDGFGIRFTSAVNKAEMKEIVAEYGSENIQISILITPKAYVDHAGGFTREKLWNYVTANSKDAKNAFIEIRSRNFYSIGEDVCTIAGTIYKFTDITIAKNPAFAAIGCIDIDTDGDGSFDRTVYGNYSSSTARSPKKVLESINYMGIQMTDTQQSWIDDFMKNYTEKTYGKAGDKTVAEQRQEIKDAFDAAMNKTVDYIVHEFAEGEVDAKYSHIKAISFDGLNVGDKKTRIFAYVGLPEGASPENPVPAVVLVHGGGGHAYMEWVRLWNERGYAAIAMENVGHFPVTPGAGVTDSKAVTAREFPQYICDVIDEENYVIAPDRKMKTTYAEVDEHWQYHGLSAVILSHNVLRQNAAVDASRIGTAGVSWGGTMVSQVIGYDTRFAFAIPTYGTAYISEPERPFIGSEYVDDLWAAERNLDNFKNPIMWFAWADDNNFVMSSYTKSFLQSRKNNPKTTLVVLSDWRHSHHDMWNQEHGYAFADSICFPEEASAYATFVTLPDGNRAASTVFLPQGATGVSASLVYLTKPIAYKNFVKYFESSWLEENWKKNATCLAIDTECGKITGKLPKDVLFYYISVSYTVDGKTLETSSNFVSVYGDGRIKETNAPIHNIAVEELGVPTAEKYPTGERARLAWDMAFYDGKVYLGSGDYSRNRGPAQISCYNPKTGLWEASAIVPDEEIDRFCVLSGTLCAPGVDPRDTDWTMGTYYVLEDGEWTVKNTVSGGIHNYDMVEFHGKLFAGLGVNPGGYPVSVSSDGGKTFTSVPFKKDGAVVNTAGYEYIRTYDFFVQGNTLYATLTLDDFYEIYRYDESLGVFLYEMNFKENVKISKYKINPLGEKVSFDGSIYFTTGYLYKTTDFDSLTPITLPGSVRVFDLFVAEGTLYVLGADQMDDGKYKTTVYALKKGASSFEAVFDFLYDVPAISMVVEGEDFYIGMGSQSLVSSKNGMLLHVNIDK